ncbi:topoisomerase DNA-binding C4 zinc finger domain-containing protein [Salinicola endophyticus]|uniref:Topoisomerase DNA-binding C4 zinc finger domain-containing protein n=1 Tax=Salinicola endophyticus TaxID=1949083 RepID=A0AB74UFZ8_9GAMM
MSGHCARCGAELRLKKHKGEKFWGCSRYPKCTWTRKRFKDSPG